MRVIRYWTSHNRHDSEFWQRTFGLANDYEFVFDAVDPQYLIACEFNYRQSERMAEFLRLDNGRRVTIFFNGEAIAPDLNIFDYAIAFDRDLACAERVVRIPTRLRFDADVDFGPRDLPSAAGGLRWAERGFCSFIYCNPIAHPRRDQLFHLLNGYRRVDSLGPYLNNCGNHPDRTDADWRRKLVRQKSAYRFAIAAENARYPGYVSEKLCSSFRAHVVPIYWGDPSVAEEFNPAAFINANAMADDELLDTVRRIDGDEKLWRRMVLEPMQTVEQQRSSEREADAFRAFFERVFDDRAPEEKKRAPSGTWNDFYRESLVRGMRSQSVWSRLFGKKGAM